MAQKPADVAVTLAEDLENPLDIQAAHEIVRYTSNDGVKRDILLLKLEQGMLLKGSRVGYCMNVNLWAPADLISLSATCVGWNLGHHENEPRQAQQRSFWMEGVSSETDVGEVVTTMSDSGEITSIDHGAGCFFEVYGLPRHHHDDDRTGSSAQADGSGRPRLALCSDARNHDAQRDQRRRQRCSALDTSRVRALLDDGRRSLADLHLAFQRNDPEGARSGGFVRLR
jgi:hypothetical protein